MSTRSSLVRGARIAQRLQPAGQVGRLEGVPAQHTPPASAWCPIFTRAIQRPELDKAVALAGELRASGVRLTLVVHEYKRLGRRIGITAQCHCRLVQRPETFARLGWGEPVLKDRTLP